MAGAFPDFTETQRFAPRVVVPFAIALALLGVGGGPALHFAAGLAPWAALLFAATIGGIFLPMLLIRLVVEVRDEGLVIHFKPLRRRVIAWKEIAQASATTYRLREIGGWGVRLGRDGRWAYTASGNEGVDLTLRDGERALFGSARATELAEAIRLAARIPTR
jgi:hypothetical protein